MCIERERYTRLPRTIVYHDKQQSLYYSLSLSLYIYIYIVITYSRRNGRSGARPRGGPPMRKTGELAEYHHRYCHYHYYHYYRYYFSSLLLLVVLLSVQADRPKGERPRGGPPILLWASAPDALTVCYPRERSLEPIANSRELAPRERMTLSWLSPWREACSQ